MKLTIFAATLALTLIAPMAQTLADPPALYVNAAVGANLGKTQPDAFTVGGGVAIDNLRISGDASRLDVGGGHAVDYSANAALDFAPDRLLNPNVELGYGHMAGATNGVQGSGDGYNAAVGLDIQPTCNLALTASVRHRERDTTGVNGKYDDNAAMLGVRLGGNRRCVTASSLAPQRP
jgi:opacity protein-like surface antigen